MLALAALHRHCGLRARGYDVTLIDRLNAIGGRAQVSKEVDFVTMLARQLLPHHFYLMNYLPYLANAARIMSNFARLTRGIDFIFILAKKFDYRPSIENTNEEIRRFSCQDVAGYAKLLKVSKSIFEIGFEKLADKPFTKFTDMLAQIPSLLRLQSYHSVAGIVQKYIKHPLLRRAFSIHPLLVGGNPFSTTSIYSLIHYLERRWGVFFAMGGTGKLVAELDSLLRRSGVAGCSWSGYCAD